MPFVFYINIVDTLQQNWSTYPWILFTLDQLWRKKSNCRKTVTRTPQIHLRQMILRKSCFIIDIQSWSRHEQLIDDFLIGFQYGSSSSDEDDGDDMSDDVTKGSRAGQAAGESRSEGKAKVNGSGSCKTCDGDTNKNKDGVYEVLIHCTKCNIPSEFST